MRAMLLRTLVLGVTVGVIGCGESEGSSPSLSGAGGGTTAVTGNGTPSVGGGSGGGNTKATTGAIVPSAGGAAVVGAGGAIGQRTTGTGVPFTKGGAPSTGTTSSPPIASTCSEADVEACAGNNSSKVAKHCGLTYEIWTDSASACMVNTAKGFTASWTKESGNYLARKGVRPGSSSPVVTYSADYKPNGNSYLAIYGWTKGPLIEYYIVDSYGDWRPPGNQAELKGTVTVDGAVYEVYKTTRVDKPSIEGPSSTFDQFWSVRKEKRTSGTITVGPHFEAWKAYGLTMGNFYEVSLVIEGYQSSGTADVTVSFK